MIAAGIDLGGSKIEAQVFAPGWQLAAKMRWPTPQGDYAALVAAMVQAMHWCADRGGASLPIGISAAGLINPATGLALTANLAASGRPMPSDIARAAGRGATWVNDCAALALSEARFGAARGADPALALIFGTGLSGSLIAKGALMPRFAGLGGEVGHFPLPAGPVLVHGLPLLACSCGRMGCTETLLSAPGLARIAAHVTGCDLTPAEVIAGRSRDAGLHKAWQIWLDLACDFLITLCFTLDPAVIVLGGGLSQAPNLTDDLAARLQGATFAGFAAPPIKLAEGGDTSGARGAACAAYQENWGFQESGGKDA